MNSTVHLNNIFGFRYRCQWIIIIFLNIVVLTVVVVNVKTIITTQNSDRQHLRMKQAHHMAKVSVSISIDTFLLYEIEQLAQKEKKTRTQKITEILTDYLKKK